MLGWNSRGVFQKYNMSFRVITTTRCQLSCTYCHREGWIEESCDRDIILDDLLSACRSVGETYGSEITLSGGEPLLHSNFDTMLQRLSHEGFSVTLLTNGHLLYNHLGVLSYLKSIHVSLPSLDSIYYLRTTGADMHGVINNIDLLRTQYPDLLLKINCVIDETCLKINNFLSEMIRFATGVNATLKLIRKFDVDSRASFDHNDLLPSLRRLGYTFQYSDGRTVFFRHMGGCPLELTEITCSAAQKYSNPCNTCQRWSDIYIGVDGQIFNCPWSSTFDNFEQIKRQSKLSYEEHVVTLK